MPTSSENALENVKSRMKHLRRRPNEWEAKADFYQIQLKRKCRIITVVINYSLKKT